MSTEEKQFDELIRSKYFEDEDEPVWDKTKVWQSIKPTKQYRIFHFRHAASLAILIGIGVLFLFFLNNKKAETGITQLQKNETKPIQLAQLKPKIDKTFTIQSINKSIKSDNSPPILTQNIIPELTKENITNVIEEQKLEVVFEETTALETPNQEIENKTTTHVITLNIPMDEDLKPKRKKRIIGRFFQQVGKYSNGEKFDWEEINIKPKKVWAYLKNSFVADSTVIY
ncbi:MAG: hypothetical protein U5M51_05930 [Emticicia sp.]|nr:hypothetical protein [Emticicia sp.]